MRAVRSSSASSMGRPGVNDCSAYAANSGRMRMRGDSKENWLASIAAAPRSPASNFTALLPRKIGLWPLGFCLLTSTAPHLRPRSGLHHQLPMRLLHREEAKRVAEIIDPLGERCRSRLDDQCAARQPLMRQVTRLQASHVVADRDRVSILYVVRWMIL